MKSILVESFSIILAVLLALAVDEWREDREHKRIAEAALINLQEEIAANITTLDAIQKHNAEVLATLDTEEATGERQIIPGIQLRHAAWDALLAAGITNHIDYDLVINLSEAYTQQAAYKQVSNQITEAAMSMAVIGTFEEAPINNDAYMANFAPYLRLMVSMEQPVMDALKKADEAIDKSLKHP